MKKTSVSCGVVQRDKLLIMRVAFGKATIDDLLADMIPVYLRAKGGNPERFFPKAAKGKH